MEFSIKNSAVSERIENCFEELKNIEYVLKGFGATSKPAPYLTRYSIIKACGVVEFGFKSIIADAQVHSHSIQIKNFIDAKFRNSSMNPSIDNIYRSLKSFDDEWNKLFKLLVKGQPDKSKLLDSLESLKDARNTFAHGGTPSTSFNSVVEYFKDSVIILQLIEEAIK